MSRSDQLVGRADDLVAVRRLLRAGAVLTLTGIGGCGKTRMAEEIADTIEAGPPFDVWFIELADLTDPDLLHHTVAGAAGLPVPGGRWGPDVLIGFFADSPGLLVLDNCEHLVEAVATLVTTLTSGCPGLTVLCTSRMPLSLSNETVYPVPPLAGDAAVDLLVRRVGAAVPGFALTDQNAVAITRLVAQLDGVPLALVLAAARLRGLPPEVLLERMDGSFAILDKGFRDSPSRQQSLTASVDWSFRLCSQAEQVLWRRLSVFAGGFEIEAAEQVCAGAGIEVGDIVDLVGSLVDQSVLTRVPDDPRRYRMLEPIRQYGDAVLRNEGEHRDYHQRHLSWFAGLVAKMESVWIGPGQLVWLRRLRAEHANLRLALETAVSEAATSPVALRICHQLEPYWFCNGLVSEARLWTERSLLAGSGSDGERALAHRLCSWFGTLQMDLDYAMEHVRLAEPLVVQADDVVLGFQLFAAGAATAWRGELDDGIELLVESVEVFRTTSHVTGLASVMFFAGMCLGFAGRLDASTALHEECLAVAEPHGETWVSAYALWALGLNALSVGDLEVAGVRAREALRVSWELRDDIGLGLHLEMLAWVAAAENHPERAALLLGCAERLWNRMSVPVSGMPYFSVLRATGASQARELGGGAAFDSAFEQGLAMSIEAAIALGLEDDASPAAPVVDLAPLTPREVEVALLVAEGLSNRDIATRLHLSARTVQSHVQSIFHRLDFGSRSQLAAWVVRRTG